MKSRILMGALVFSLGNISMNFALADEVDSQIETMEQEAKKDPQAWNEKLKTKYNLTDEQMASLQAKGFSKPQMAMTAELAAKSGKSIDEIASMRTESKMGWGKIAKELNVHPGSLGQSVSGMNRKERAEKIKERKAERLQAKKERFEAKKERFQAKKERFQNKKEALQGKRRSKM